MTAQPQTMISSPTHLIKRVSGLGPLPAGPQSFLIKPIDEPRLRLGGEQSLLAAPKRCWRNDARSLAIVDLWPAGFGEFYLVQETLTSCENKILGRIGMIEQPVPAFAITSDASVARTFPLFVPCKNWIRRVFFPGPEQGFC